jgi:hypothetical protein
MGGFLNAISKLNHHSPTGIQHDHRKETPHPAPPCLINKYDPNDIQENTKAVSATTTAPEKRKDLPTSHSQETNPLLKQHRALLHSQHHDDSLSTSDTNTVENVEKGALQSGDVWYRKFVKPLTRKHRSVPYRESFQQRMLRPVGIPIYSSNNNSSSVISTLQELFKPSMRYYSPLYGMIFTYNNCIDNLYRYGNPQSDPSVVLIRMLFHSLPGGEVQATHLSGMAAAHLSPSVIGVILETVAELTQTESMMLATATTTTIANNNSSQSGLTIQSRLAGILLDKIVNHPDYKESRQILISDLECAQDELKALHKRDQDSQTVRDSIKHLEGDIIKRGKHVINRLQKTLVKTNDTDKIADIQRTIAAQVKAIEKAEEEVEQLRHRIVTGEELKAARKSIQRAQYMIEREKQSRKSLADAMAASFCSFELGIFTNNQSPAPKFITTMVLLGYIWRKYDSVHALEGYLQSMERIGALKCSATEAIEKTKQRDIPLVNDSVYKRLLSTRHPKWTVKDVADAVAIMLMKPGVARRPPIVPFSYVSWSSYSKFPDCGEKALHNLFNQLLFDPSSGDFDVALLIELKQSFYPNMEQKLIEFYRRHPRPQQALEHDVAKDWIEVTSYLNKGSRQGPGIRYRREKQQQNIASPLSNALRVFNALLGIEPLDRVCLEEVIQRINSLRGWNLKADTSCIKPDGFGIVEFSDGHVLYELQSYRPVHFGFVQVETLELDAIGLRDFKIFQKLMSSFSGIIRENGESANFEQLALASLHIPYDLQRRRVSRFLQKLPLHYQVLFADMNGTSERQAMMKWCEHRECTVATTELLIGIQNYKEPTFMPLKKSAETFDDEFI